MQFIIIYHIYINIYQATWWLSFRLNFSFQSSGGASHNCLCQNYFRTPMTAYCALCLKPPPKKKNMYGLRDYLGFLRSWQRVSSGMSLVQNNVKANWLVSSWVMWYLCTRRPPPPPTPGWPRTPGRWWTLPATRQTRWQRPAGREPGRNLQTQRDADTDGSSHPQGEAAVSRKADRPDRCRGDKEKKKKHQQKENLAFLRSPSGSLTPESSQTDNTPQKTSSQGCNRSYF